LTYFINFYNKKCHFFTKKLKRQNQYVKLSQQKLQNRGPPSLHSETTLSADRSICPYRSIMVRNRITYIDLYQFQPMVMWSLTRAEFMFRLWIYLYFLWINRNIELISPLKLRGRTLDSNHWPGSSKSNALRAKL
jgi:hypothetical protein